MNDKPNRQWAYDHLERLKREGFSQSVTSATVAIAMEAVRVDKLLQRGIYEESPQVNA